MKILKYLWIATALCPRFAGAVDHWRLNMYRGVMPLSHAMYDLHTIALWVCVVIGVVVFGVMIYSLIKFRKSKGAVAAQFSGNMTLEIVWAIIPFIILIVLAVPATRVSMEMDNSSHSDVTVKKVYTKAELMRSGNRA